ncbi:hypothetical protein [Candidatus Litorirhabdus singularis]|uniref:hypothetical protein n=1 Tax=Candidatus Litorirhabdus singularis TaxID=2518993 RepID=UPI00242A44FB|nr:hypothetical protein [Candidatus Litorirhabdus singularis]
MKDNSSTTVEQAGSLQPGQNGVAHDVAIPAGLPCRGCTSDCALRAVCQGKPWRTC